MGRGVSAGGGQSSLGYLFGSEAPAPAPSPQPPPPKDLPTSEPSSKAPVAPAQADNSKATPPSTGGGGYATNNYHRTDGPNCGNFITDRPSTKVHAAPGGGSSLDYLFGDGSK